MSEAVDYLSIGEVLALIKHDFPDVSISKIRYLESQGLIDPERTPSGYRKFYQSDIERLKQVLFLQRDSFLPLKVIKDTLDGKTSAVSELPIQPGLDFGSVDSSEVDLPKDSRDARIATLASSFAGRVKPNLRAIRGELDAEGDRVIEPSPMNESLVTEGTDISSVPKSQPSSSQVPVDQTNHEVVDGREASTPAHDNTLASTGSPVSENTVSTTGVPKSADESNGQRGVEEEIHSNAHGMVESSWQQRFEADLAHGVLESDRGFGDVRSELFSIEELSRLTGAKISEIKEIESYGLIDPKRYVGETYYTKSDFEIVQIVLVFKKYGVSSRHLRMYKTSAEREVGFMEQVITPFLRQKNPQARHKAVEQLSDLRMLGTCLRSYFIEKLLEKYMDL